MDALPFGGNRAWFHCPACGRQSAILYGADVFACRHCLQLAYESQREAPHCRALHKAQGIHEKLGGTGIVDDCVFKPKGMHWRTYTRQLERLRRAESRAVRPWLMLSGQANLTSRTAHVHHKLFHPSLIGRACLPASPGRCYASCLQLGWQASSSSAPHRTDAARRAEAADRHSRECRASGRSPWGAG